MACPTGQEHQLSFKISRDSILFELLVRSGKSISFRLKRVEITFCLNGLSPLAWRKLISNFSPVP